MNYQTGKYWQSQAENKDMYVEHGQEYQKDLHSCVDFTQIS